MGLLRQYGSDRMQQLDDAICPVVVEMKNEIKQMSNIVTVPQEEWERLNTRVEMLEETVNKMEKFLNGYLLEKLEELEDGVAITRLDLDIATGKEEVEALSPEEIAEWAGDAVPA